MEDPENAHQAVLRHTQALRFRRKALLKQDGMGGFACHAVLLLCLVPVLAWDGSPATYQLRKLDILRNVASRAVRTEYLAGVLSVSRSSLGLDGPDCGAFARTMLPVISRPCTLFDLTRTTPPYLQCSLPRSAAKRQPTRRWGPTGQASVHTPW